MRHLIGWGIGIIVAALAAIILLQTLEVNRPIIVPASLQQEVEQMGTLTTAIKFDAERFSTYSTTRYPNETAADHAIRHFADIEAMGAVPVVPE